MRGRFTPQILGVGLAALAAVFAVLALAALLAREPWWGFGAGALGAGALSGPLLWFGRSSAEPTRREALMGVLLLWLAIPLFGALPYAVGGGFPWIDAVFESMSGFTTTGATTVQDFDAVGPVLYLWRALTQWFGGVGIVVLFIAVFPQLAIAGRQLFFAELPGPTEQRLTPRLRKTADAVLLVYLGLTGACIAGYVFAGMGLYDAVVHTLTTVSSGGFSPEARSMEPFPPAVHYVACVFMFLAGANFALQFRVLLGRPLDLARDVEFRAYLYVTLVGTTALVVALASSDALGLEARLRHGLFQTLSILTSTGYATTDFALWSLPAQAVLVALMFVGGSAGSTSGGVKVMRWLILVKHTSREVRRALHPRAILPLRVGQRTVPSEVLDAVAAFITLYVGLFAACTLALVALGSDFVTAFTASIAAVGNIGPGLRAVGPMASFADLHPVAKGMLTFAMYAGRLEVVTVFVVFTTGWWRLPRRRGPV